MADLGSAVFTLFTDPTPFERGLRAASATADAATASIGSKISKMGDRFITAGRAMTRGITVPMLAIGAVSVKLAANYQRDLIMLHTQAGATVKEMHRVDGEIRNMVKSGQTAFSMDQLAKAMYHIESLNFHAAKAYKMLQSAQKGASVGNADLEQTTTALGAAILTHIKGLGSYDHAMGLVMATVGQGNMRLQDFVDAMKSGLVSTARTAHVDFPSLAAALTVVTDRTGSAAVAANRLRTLLMMVAAPTDKAKAALKTLGMTSTQLGLDMQKPNGILVAVKDLAAHLAKLPKGERKSELSFIAPMFGGSRSTGTMATLLTAINSMEKKYPLILAQSHNFNKEFGATQQTAMFKFHRALAQVEQSLVVIGTKLMPVVAKIFNDMAKKISELVGWYQKLNPQQQHFVNTLLEIALVMGPVSMVFGAFLKVLGPLISVLRIFGKGLLLLLGLLPDIYVAFVGLDGVMIMFGATTVAVSLPVLAVVAALVALGAALVWLYTHNKTFHHAVIVTWNAIKHVVGTVVNFIIHHWRLLMVMIIGPLGVAINLIISYWDSIRPVVMAVVHFIQAHWKSLATFIRDVLYGPIQHVIDIFNTLKADAMPVWNSIASAVGTVVGWVRGLISWLGKIHWPSPPGWLSSLAGKAGDIVGKATGTGASGGYRSGWTLVGEQGPEMVKLPHGSYINTAGATAAMLGAGGGSGGVVGMVSRIRIDNWQDGWATIETQTTNAIDQNNRFLRRH